jgi:hypothetical protein
MNRFLDNLSVPTLDIKDRNGSTGYIDFITTNDMQDNWMMKGRDDYFRPFLAICVNTTNPKFSRVVGTIFQRYDDNYRQLAFGTCYPLDYIFYDSRVRDEFDINLLKERIKALSRGERLRIFDNSNWNQNVTYQGNGDTYIFVESIRKQISSILEKHFASDIVYTIMNSF